MNNKSQQQRLSVTWSAQAQDLNHATSRALLFMLGSTTYGVSVEFVRRVMEMPSVVAVAGSSPWLKGLANCDGSAIPLLDTQAILGQVPASPSQVLKRAIIIDCAHGSAIFAVEQITTLSDLSAKRKHQTIPAEYPADFIEYSCEANGVTIGVLNVAKLFQFASLPADKFQTGAIA